MKYVLLESGISAEKTAELIAEQKPDVAVTIASGAVPFDWVPIKTALIAEELQKRGISTVANNTFVSVAAFDKWRSNIMFRSFVKAAKGIYIHHELYIAEKKNKSISVNVYKEYVLYRNGEWFIIEINPRWSGMTTTTAAMEGRNPLAIFVDSILGTDKNYSMKPSVSTREKRIF